MPDLEQITDDLSNFDKEVAKDILEATLFHEELFDELIEDNY